MDQWLRAIVTQRILRKHSGLPPEPAVADAERELAQALAAIDRALAGDRHLAGDAFSLATSR